MARISGHEADFFRALQGEGPFAKEAVDLDADTEAALGIPGVSPSDLDDVESKAKSQQELGGPPKGEQVQPEEQPAAAPEEMAGQELQQQSPPPELAEPPQDTQQELPVEPDAGPPQPATQQASPRGEPEMPFPDEGEVDAAIQEAINAEEPATDEVLEDVPDEPSAADVPPERWSAHLIGDSGSAPTRASHGKVFTKRTAHPLTLLAIMDARYQGGWTEWVPETMWAVIRRDFGSVGELTRNKLLSVRLAATTDIPWLDWDVFEKCGLAWNDIVPIFGAMQPMSPMQTAFTVHVLRNVRADEPFDPEVAAYMAAVLDTNGWVYAPTEYFPEGVQELLNRKEGAAAFRDEVSDAWDRVRHMNAREIGWRDDHPLDMHLLKLFVVQEYLRDRERVRAAHPVGDEGPTTSPQPVR